MAVGPCGHENPHTSRFCATCGAPLERDAMAFGFGGERRQLTVLFSDLVGSTEIASAIDPEQFREIVDEYYRICADCIVEHGGHVASYLGDGVLAYFGYPAALEDAAARGVRAGLAIRDAMLGAHRGGGGTAARLQVRVGLHTGIVVIDEVGGASRRETHALGDAMNLAARVQGAAAPGEVLVTDATFRLVGDAFVLEDAGAQALKGIAEEVRLHRVVTAAEPIALGRVGRQTTFVGRSRERATLQERLAAAAAGTGQVVLIVGEPGVGKSRLAAALRDEVDPDIRWVEGHASAYQRHTPFGVIVDLIRRTLSQRGATSPEEQRAALASDLAGTGGNAAEGARLIAALIGIAPERQPPTTAAEAERRRTIAWIVTWLAALATDGPAVIVLEDLHWADPSTAEVLTALVERLVEARLLVVLTSRPTETLQMEPAEGYAVLALDNLDASQTRQLIEEAIGNAGPAVIDVLVERSDGIPLFAEQLARAVAERGDGDLDSIPPTLHDSLMARLDGLGAAKPVAQVAAVVGREFSAGLLRHISGLTPSDLDAALGVLVDSELVSVLGVPDERRFVFQHALVQQAAYSALLRRDRRALHRQVADVIGETASIEVVARHRTLAEQHEEAADAWSRAARTASARSAWAEAREHLRHAIDEVRQLPESPATVERELTLELQRHQAIEMSGAFAGPESRASIERARALSGRLGEPRARITVLSGLWSTALNNGRLDGALQLAEEMMRAADATGDPGHRRQADIAFAGTKYNRGAVDAAIDHAAAVLREHGASDAVPPFERAQALMYGTLAGTLGLRSEPTMRWAEDLRDIALAADGDVIATVLARVGCTIVAVWQRDYEAVTAMAALLAETAETYGIPMFSAFADLYGGWESAMRGSADGAIARIERGLNTHVGFEQALGLNHSFSLLAEAQLTVGELTDGLASVEEGLLAAPFGAQPMHSAELLRIRAALRAAASDHPEPVRKDLDRAVAVAAEHGCELVVLRTTTQLARWLCERGRRDEARERLRDVLATRGMTMPLADVSAATALARELDLEGS